MSSLLLARCAVVCMAIVGIAVPASAQSSLATGTRVRLSMAEKGRAPLIGALASVTADSIAVTNDRGATFSVARGSIRRLDVSQGRRRPIMRDALIGGGIGLVIGAGLGAATYEPCEGFCIDPIIGSRAGAAAVLGGLFGAAGLGVGAIIGASQMVEVWRPVNLDVRPALLTGGDGGTRLALVLRLGS